MNKIPSVFLRDVEDMSIMTRELNPLCQWVIEGEGTPTRKYDGTCVMHDESGRWWARREVKPGKEAPPEFQLLGVDEITGKTMGYEPIENTGFYRWWTEEHELANFEVVTGTYELCGPKINDNPEGYKHHILIPHAGAARFTVEENGVEREVIDRYTYDVIKSNILAAREVMGWEGIVWHHPDGRMAKMKARDYKKEAS